MLVVSMVMQFSNDITRIVSRVIHPRQKVRIDEEKVRKFLSPEAQTDNDLAVAELNAIISSIEQKINSLAPEEVLVYLDSLEFEVENSSNAGLSSEYTVLQEMINARLSAGSKTNGTVLGFAPGSSNIASSEIMLFMRSVSNLEGTDVCSYSYVNLSGPAATPTPTPAIPFPNQSGVCQGSSELLDREQHQKVIGRVY